jgi:hypothetical protein
VGVIPTHPTHNTQLEPRPFVVVVVVVGRCVAVVVVVVDVAVVVAVAVDVDVACAVAVAAMLMLMLLLLLLLLVVVVVVGFHQLVTGLPQGNKGSTPVHTILAVGLVGAGATTFSLPIQPWHPQRPYPCIHRNQMDFHV